MFDLTKLNQYIITMSNNPFLSKSVSFKRILKGLVISIPCTIMILYIGIYYADQIDTSLREHYIVNSKDEVLGVVSDPQLIGSYGDVGVDDTFVWEWDRNWERDGYYKLERFVEDPEYFINDKEFKLEDTWELRNGYELTLSCIELDMTKTVAGDYYPCTLSYDGQILTENLRYEAYCKDFENTESCHGLANFRVFSDTYSDTDSNEYVVVSEWASGSKDWISVYRLNNGTATLLPFLYEGEEDDRWYISSYSYDMYGLYSTWENMKNFNDPVQLVTSFHEPSMGSKNPQTLNNVEDIYRIWDVVGDRLELKETVVDLYREGDTAHWL
jgi:hypothetical protein